MGWIFLSFPAVLPTNTGSAVDTVWPSHNAYESTDKPIPICGTPMYNDPEYLASMVAEEKTSGVFIGVGQPMNIPLLEKASGALLSEIGPPSSPSSKLVTSSSSTGYYRHVMCKDIDETGSPWNPINPTTTFLPTDTAARLLVTVEVDINITSRWYYRNDDLDGTWDYYGGLTQPVPSPGIYDYWVGVNIAGNPDLPSYPRGWVVDVYLDGGYYFSEYFEITDNGWQCVTCEDVLDMNGHEPVNVKDTFTIGVDPVVWYYLRLYDVAYYTEITDHCHDYKIVWYQPDDTVYETMGPDGWADYKDTDPTWDAWVSTVAYGYVRLFSNTPTGQWRIETYIDTYYDGEEEWYLLTTITFTVQPGPTQVFYYYEYDQLTGTSTQKSVEAAYYGQTSDGNFEIYYDKNDPHIDSAYISNVTDAAVNSWSQLIPLLGSPYDMDGDGLTEVLIVDLNKYNEIVYSGILGYVQYVDENGLGMIYLDNDLDLWTSWYYLRHAFSHEFTHRIEYSYDPFEQVWILEGMAQFGGDYSWPFSVGQGYVNAFQKNPDVQLTGDSFESYYCAGYVFFEYVAEAFGTSAVRTILDNTTVHDGTTAVENALGVPFDTLFNEFAVKNYANDYAGTSTTFEGIDIWAVPAASHAVTPSASGSNDTNLWATDYVKFTSISQPLLKISFSGGAGRAHHVKAIKVVGDFSSYSVDDVALTDNQGSITIPDADTYSQIALMATRHEDSYPDADWTYSAEALLGEYTLAEYPHPFLTSVNNLINMTIVVPSSSPHGPCGGAHTMDVMSAVIFATKLGEMCEGHVTEEYVTMDDYMCVYNASDYKVYFTGLVDRNLMAVAGPGVNEVAYYYNSLKVGGGYPPYDFAMPVTLLKFPNGTDYIQVWPTGNTYKIEYEPGTGHVYADYGILQIYNDVKYGRYVLIVYGLGGEGTKAASLVLANYQTYALSGHAAIIRYYDSDANGYLDTIQIVETVD